MTGSKGCRAQVRTQLTILWQRESVRTKGQSPEELCAIFKPSYHFAPGFVLPWVSPLGTLMQGFLPSGAAVLLTL